MISMYREKKDKNHPEQWQRYSLELYDISCCRFCGLISEIDPGQHLWPKTHKKGKTESIQCPYKCSSSLWEVEGEQIFLIASIIH